MPLRSSTTTLGSPVGDAVAGFVGDGLSFPSASEVGEVVAVLVSWPPSPSLPSRRTPPVTAPATRTAPTTASATTLVRPAPLPGGGCGWNTGCTGCSGWRR